MRLTPVFVFCLLLLLTACAPDDAGTVRVLPTLASTPTAAIDIESAQRAAVLFLDAWKRQDFPGMYRMITFDSQEAISLEKFQEVYTDAQNEMTFASLSITTLSLLRQADRVVQLNYDVTFATNLLGTFSDTNRTLNLVLDTRANEWRVSWSVGDIFPEMGTGAALKFESGEPLRANIYDRNGKVLADQNGIWVRINIIKDDIPTDLATCIASVVSVTGRPTEVIQAIFDRAGGNWVTDVGSIDTVTYDRRHAELEQTCAATFAQRPVRRYIGGFGSLMPHILGTVGYPEKDQIEALEKAGFNQETLIGKSGIEQVWDETLRGKPGGRLSLMAPDGSRVRVLAERSSQIPESLWLTIDADLQEYVLRVIGEAYAAASTTWAQTSNGASAIVMNVKTGEILAMVSYPTYNGNAFTPFPMVEPSVAQATQQQVAEDKRLPLLNRPVQGLYPAGSTMKVIDATAVLDSGVMTRDEKYVCTGIWQYDGDTRYDWLAGGHGTVTVETALMQSCNPFFYTTGFKLNTADPNLLPQYARRLGLGGYTGLTDIPEAKGIVGDPEWMMTNYGLPWSYSDAISMAIGQGPLQVTPLEMARVYAGIATDGTQMKPRLVREKGILDQRTFLATPEVNNTFNLKPDVLKYVRNGLCLVTTNPSGTAEFVFRRSPLQDIGVCGKTGTAQDGPSGNGKMSHAWFIGFAPKDDPEIVVLVMVENSGEGSAVAAPLVRQIMEYYFLFQNPQNGSN